MLNSSRFIQGPVHSVRADVSIRDAIAIMRKYHVGALLVLRADNSGVLQGIFTERDLLERVANFELPKVLDQPIVHVMTKNPKTVLLNELPEIPKLMVRLGVRHIPVVEIVNGAKRPVGIVSMRDCFRWLYESETSSPFDFSPRESTSRKRVTIGVHGESKTLRRLFEGTYGQELEIVTITPESSVRSLPLVVIDIDGVKASEWASLIKAYLAREARALLVCYDPNRHSEMESILLTRLKASPKLRIFKRPIHLFEFFSTINRLQAGKRLSV